MPKRRTPLNQTGFIIGRNSFLGEELQTSSLLALEDMQRPIQLQRKRQFHSWLVSSTMRPDTGESKPSMKPLLMRIITSFCGMDGGEVERPPIPQTIRTMTRIPIHGKAGRWEWPTG